MLDLFVKPRVVDEPGSRSWARTARRSGQTLRAKAARATGASATRRNRSVFRPLFVGRPCAEFLVAAVDSPCVLTQFPGDRLLASVPINPTRHGTRHPTTAATELYRIIRQKFRGMSPTSVQSPDHATNRCIACMIAYSSISIVQATRTTRTAQWCAELRRESLRAISRNPWRPHSLNRPR